MNITIGTDPEFWVKLDNKFVSAHGLVEGTKYNPQIVRYGAVQVDGMALEFNTDPVTTKEDFSYNIYQVLAAMRNLIPSKYEFDFSPVAHFGFDYISEQPDEAKELGCEPDFNAYTGKVNPTPDSNGDFRTAAGHIHIGIDRELTVAEQQKLVILCDLFMGLPSLSWDSDTKRRELYGRAGCFRVKPYGIEYRTLSNAWLESRELQERVFELATIAASNLDNFVEIFKLIKDELGFSYKYTEAIINDSDTEQAQRVLDVISKYMG